MAVAANIVLADAQATPVNHTFVPVGRDPKDSQTYIWEDQSQANAVGYWRITAKMVKPAAAKQGENSAYRVNRVIVTLSEPVLEVLSNSTVSGILPAPVIAYIPRSSTEYILHERTSKEQRQSLRKMNYNLQNNAQVVDMVENLINVQG